jgi:hypothetical protein
MNLAAVMISGCLTPDSIFALNNRFVDSIMRKTLIDAGEREWGII